MKRLTIPEWDKVDMVWVEYLVCEGQDWWQPIAVAELKIRQEGN